jgi:hypothetical protein
MDGRTESHRHDEADSRCSKFCESEPNKEAHVIRHTSPLTRCDNNLIIHASSGETFNPSNAKLNPICHLLALLATSVV